VSGKDLGLAARIGDVVTGTCVCSEPPAAATIFPAMWRAWGTRPAGLRSLADRDEKIESKARLFPNS